MLITESNTPWEVGLNYYFPLILTQKSRLLFYQNRSSHLRSKFSLVEGGVTRWKTGGCRQCKLPGKANIWWIPVSSVQQDCQDIYNPDDLCHCEPGNPPRLIVDKNGSQKGQKCNDPSTGKLTKYRPKQTWPCFWKAGE